MYQHEIVYRKYCIMHLKYRLQCKVQCVTRNTKQTIIHTADIVMYVGSTSKGEVAFFGFFFFYIIYRMIQL